MRSDAVEESIRRFTFTHFFETFRIRNETTYVFPDASRNLYHYYVVLSMHAIWRRREISNFIDAFLDIFFNVYSRTIRKLRSTINFTTDNWCRSRTFCIRNQTKRNMYMFRASQKLRLYYVALLHYVRDLMLPQNIQCYRCTSRYFSNITNIYMRIV